MSEFVEPITQELTFTFRKSLRKDKNEEICPCCKGLGWLPMSNPFGLKDDFGKIIMFENQILQPCFTCFNGVVKRCEYCGELIPKNRLKCNCKEQKRIDRIEEERKEAERMENAELVPADQFDMYYSDYYNANYGYFSCFEDFFDEWQEYVYDGDLTDNDRPEFVYGTTPIDLKIDAYDIVENACEDMYEDAICDTDDKSINELQAYLDDWCSKCGIGTTYYHNKRYKVRIPWEEMEVYD